MTESKEKKTPCTLSLISKQQYPISIISTYLPLSGPRLPRRDNHRGEHDSDQEEVLRHQVLGGLRQQQRHGRHNNLIHDYLQYLYYL